MMVVEGQVAEEQRKWGSTLNMKLDIFQTPFQAPIVCMPDMEAVCLAMLYNELCT